MGNNLPWPLVPFESLLSEPLRNGIYKKKEFHGRGCKIVNMGELFGHPRLTSNIEMNLVELTDKEKEKSLLKTGDLIFARRSLTAEGAGKCTLIQQIQEETTFESSIIRARLDSSKASPEFFYYMFNSPVGKWLLGTILRQTAVAGITGSDLAKLKVPCPPLAVQEHLAEQGRTIDDKITLNRQINQTLEQMAQTLFKSWFVDFDPVIDNALDAGFFEQDLPIPDELQHRALIRQEQRKAMRQGQATAENGGDAQIGEAPGKQQPLPDEVRQLFPDAFEESELGWVPKGWGAKPLADVTSLIIDHRGKTPKKLGGDWAEHGYPAISAKNIKGGRIVRHDTIRYVDTDLFEKWMKNPLAAGDIVMTSEAPMGEMLYLSTSSDFLLSQRLYGIRANSKILSGCYLYFWLHTNKAKADLDGRATGTTVVGIRQSELRQVNVMVPNTDVVDAFTNHASGYLKKCDVNELQSRQLEALRDTLLPKLISGELRLDDIEAAVEQETVNA